MEGQRRFISGGGVIWLYRIVRLLRRLRLGRVVAFVKHRLPEARTLFEAEIDGLHLTGSTVADYSYVRELLSGRESFMTEVFVRSVRPGMHVADIGAYLGFLTLQAARRVGPTGGVYAFEPNPRAFDLLQANIGRNGFRDRATARCWAVADQRGPRDFFSDRGSTSSFFPQDAAARVEVECVRLDDVFTGEARCDVIKLDVEGAEVLALAGMAETVTRSHSRLFVECNPTALAHGGATVGELIESLRALGLRIAVIEESTRRLVPLTSATRFDPWVNLYCEPE